MSRASTSGRPRIWSNRPSTPAWRSASAGSRADPIPSTPKGREKGRSPERPFSFPVQGVLADLGVPPFEASPSVPLHCVEREGPEIEIFQIRQDCLSHVPPLHAVERGSGGEA